MASILEGYIVVVNSLKDLPLSFCAKEKHIIAPVMQYGYKGINHLKDILEEATKSSGKSSFMFICKSFGVPFSERKVSILKYHSKKGVRKVDLDINLNPLPETSLIQEFAESHYAEVFIEALNYTKFEYNYGSDEILPSTDVKGIIEKEFERGYQLVTNFAYVPKYAPKSQPYDSTALLKPESHHEPASFVAKLPIEPVLCVKGCGYYANPNYQNMCSKCSSQSKRKAEDALLLEIDNIQKIAREL
jgi:hypothetical protein